YDWATFITAYACGRWDPHRTPRLPHAAASAFQPPESTPKQDPPSLDTVPRGALAFERTRAQPLPPSHRLRASFSAASSTSKTLPPAAVAPMSIAPPPYPTFSLPAAIPSTCTASHIPSASTSTSTAAFASTAFTASPAAATHAQTSAATLRWAGARVRVAPLSLPSPEHELVDPMRNAAAVPIPGSYPEFPAAPHHHPRSSQSHSHSVHSRSRTPSGSGMLSTIDGSPATPDLERTAPLAQDVDVATAAQAGSVSMPDTRDPTPTVLHPVPIPHLPPATAPSPSARAPNSPITILADAATYSAPSDHWHVVRDPDSSPGTDLYRDSTAQYRFEHGHVARSVPAPGHSARRHPLTRQTSAPLPEAEKARRKADEGQGQVPGQALGRWSAKEDARAAREERAFAQRGFLAPPFPPDELGRRRALYKFNIVNTGPDLNFDRIAHLAKLVFNTKGVLISVVDEVEEWFKSEWGVNQMHSCARASSFAAHAILQRGDEPTIVLDSRLDWRFAKSPLVVGSPNIRFYAGAPLRTQDGFNIGCLALIDDAPRDDFTPRQRHTLKEFAAIAMREMELWRDKIQLRIRDRIQNSASSDMEQFSRECLEIDNETTGQASKDERKNERENNKEQSRDKTESHKSDLLPHGSDPPDLIGSSSSMDIVYDRAAKLVQRTLDVDGVIVIDVSHCEVLESMSSEATVAVVLHHGDADLPTSTHTLTVEEYARLNEFFARYPEGRVSEGIVPPPFRLFLPQAHIQYALVVPIYNIDKRPFALLCAWNASDQTKRFLEGHELSYLRAIGVIILSAVLKRRMILADKAKSLFISNISHELRTPLHGILAAAELLGDSSLNHSQMSFLQTVQACGTSLVETVNHVLDFTKLSGNSKAGGVEMVIVPSKVDLMQLVEEAVDGCWIGHRARTAIMGDTGIGSVYSPPEELSTAKQLVETVVEIGWRKGGWSLKCEKGGIRRVLMNVFGNSLKFTTNGYVHVSLRELPRSSDEAPNEIKAELSVLDTGKGISEDFRKNQLFHPFSQENPLQTGTGLGLAIVNSIINSESVNGKVDVWSEEGIGTEIKVTFTAQVTPDEAPPPEMEPFIFDDPAHPATVSLVGFDMDHKGVQLLYRVIQTYLISWWGFEERPPEQGLGEIVVLNEDVELVRKATAKRDTSRPFILLSTLHGNPTVLAVVAEHENIGGFCRVIYKPGGPTRLHAMLKLCLHANKIRRSGATSPAGGEVVRDEPLTAGVPRRNSEHASAWKAGARPMMSPRASTIHPLSSLSWRKLNSMTVEKEEPLPAVESGDGVVPTIKIGAGGTLLQSSMGTINADVRRFRVLVVEDNNILRMLLIKWLTNRGYDYRDAVDGRKGVIVYEEDGPFDVVLLDMSMPNLDGIGATTEIRRIEERWLMEDPKGTPTRILALTGMSSLEDKRRAFEAGVDGYLVKPVAFKTLDEMFSKLGVS
ncbi:hypothetical protein GGX14DRAFT_354775, partial [Mycena pura]